MNNSASPEQLDMGQWQHLGIVCSAEDHKQVVATNGTKIHCLTRGDSIGLTVTVEACLISLVAVVYVFAVILRTLIWRIRHLSTNRFNIFQQPMDLLMFTLFFSDILQALGNLLSVRWVSLGKVEAGSYCTAQGVIQSIGEPAVAMTTLVIAGYTFVGLWMGRNVTSMRVIKLVLLCIWLFLGIIVLVGNTVHRHAEPPFQAPSPYWCWVNNNTGYLPWKIFGEYIWFWLALALLIIVYIPLFFWMRGNMVIHETKWWKVRFQRSAETDPAELARRRKSFILLAYPIIYCFNILPLSVVRWITFADPNSPAAPSGSTFFASSIYGLSGLFNVVLLLVTKPESALFNPRLESGPLLPHVSGTPEPVQLQVVSERKGGSEYSNDEGMLPPRR